MFGLKRSHTFLVMEYYEVSVFDKSLLSTMFQKFWARRSITDKQIKDNILPTIEF